MRIDNALDVLDSLDTKKKTNNVFEMEGLETHAFQLKELKKQIVNLEAQYKLISENVIDEVLARLRELEAIGEIYKTASIGHGVTVTRSDRYKTITPNEHEKLQALDIPDFFTLDEKAAVKPEMITSLKAALGDNFENFVKLKKEYKLRKDFITERASLRPNLTDTQNTILDELVYRLGYKPSIKVK